MWLLQFHSISDDLIFHETNIPSLIGRIVSRSGNVDHGLRGSRMKYWVNVCVGIVNRWLKTVIMTSSIISNVIADVVRVATSWSVISFVDGWKINFDRLGCNIVSVDELNSDGELFLTSFFISFFFVFFQNNAVLLVRLIHVIYTDSAAFMLHPIEYINLQLYRFSFNQIRINAICIYTFSIFLRFSFIDL